MRHGRLVATFAAIILACALAPAAQGGVTPALQERLSGAAASDRVAVVAVLRAQVDGEDYAGRPAALLAALRRTAGATQPAVVDDVDAPVRRFWLVNAVALDATPGDVAALAADPAVETVDVDHPVRVADAVAEGTPYPDAGDGNWGLTAVSAPQAQSAYGVSGAGVRVGSIDTGVDATHAALAGRVVAWRDFVNGRSTPYDDNGHGTHTVGTMIGSGAGGAPIGVAPGAQVVVAKAVSAGGTGPGSALLAAAQWMTDPDGNPATADHPTVINNSWSSSNANDPWFRPMIRTWIALGIVPVFAAGNSGPGASTLGSPAGYPEAIAVGATSQGDSLAEFSARGPVVWQNLDGQGPAAGTVLTKPDLVAPGVNIVSSVPGGYLGYSGTSMAAPHVAGVVALLRQARPGLSVPEVADILRGTATDLGPAGADPATGAGRLDAAAALAAVRGPVPDTRFAVAPPSVTAEGTLTLQLALSGGATSVRVRADGGEWGAPEPGGTATVTLGSGRHTIEAQGIAPSGATDPSPASATVTVDRSGPSLSFTARRQGAALRLVARADDELSGIDPGSLRWSTDDGQTMSGPSVRYVPRTGGSHRVRLTAQDLVGNTRTITRTVSATGATSSPIRRLMTRGQVSRRSGRLVVSGRLTRGATVRATLVPSGGGVRVASAQPSVAVRRTAAGTFRLAVPVRGLATGRYRLVVSTLGPSGSPLGTPVERAVRVIR